MDRSNSPSAPARGPFWLCPLAVLLSCALVVTLIPVLAVGGYIHPFGDDYIFGVPAYYALNHGESVPAAMLNTVKVYWFGWQGTFSGVLAMELMPDTFFYRAYAITPYVMIGLLALSLGKLLHTAVCRWLKGSRRHWLALWTGTLLLWVQCLPDPAQSFYWWNGAALYTLFFALMVLLLDRLANLPLSGWRRSTLAGAVALAVLVSGGNFVTCLLAGLLVGLFWLAVLIRDRGHWRGATLVLALYAAGFLINLIAPGNRVRQSGGEGMGPVQAVWSSLTQGWTDLSGFATPFVLVIFLLLAPVLWSLTEDCGFTFPLPGAAVLLSFLLFAAQNAPHFYTMGEVGPGRIRDITFFFYILMALADEWYLLGWLHRRWRGPGQKLIALCTGAAVLLAVVIFWKNAPWLTCGKAAAALKDDSLAAYHQTMLEREAMYRDPELTEVYYEPAMDDQPRLIFVYSVDDTNPEAFPNIAARNYFRKEIVACIPE